MISSQERARRASAASCPRSPPATTSSSSTSSSSRRSREAGRRRSTTIELVAATQGPGLVGALLVGFSTAKALAAARELPFAPVDHLQGHVAANFLRRRRRRAPFEPPFVCLIASGGHTLLAHVREHDGFEVLGRTLDDAAGEAFDKGARMLGLGYPGRRRRSSGWPRAAIPTAFAFPGSRARARARRARRAQAFAQGLDFSFAGLKTALLYRLRELAEAERRRARRRPRGLLPGGDRRQPRSRAPSGRSSAPGLDRLAVGGGVAANGELRRRLARARGRRVHVPARALCTDNAAMIASAARYAARAAPTRDYLALDAYATGERPLSGERPRRS